MKIFRKIYRWCTKTRLRKVLSLTLAVLIFLTSIRFIFIPAPKVHASDTYIPLNEGYGTTARDSVSSNNGTFTGVTWKNEDMCVSGKCAYFDGANTSIDIADNASLDFGTGSFTVEFWFRQTSQALDYLVAKFQNSIGTDSPGFAVRIQADGDVEFVIDDDTTFTPDDLAGSNYNDNRYNDNKWHFVSAVKSGTSSITLYMDGVQVGQDATLAASGSLDNNNPLTIGHDGALAADFTGFIDEFKIYSSARTAAQVKTDFTGLTTSRGVSASFGPNQSYLSTGLTGYWKMDETTWATNCSTASAIDSSGNGNNGKPCPNASAPTLAGGRFGDAGVFDGSNDYVDLPASSVLTTRSEFTIAAWIKPTPSTTHADTIIGFGNSAEEILFGVDTSTQLMMYFGGWTDSIRHSSSGVSSGVWQHVVVTRKGSNVTFYINGTADFTDNAWPAEDTSISGTTRNLGGDSTSNEDYPGSLDEVRVYNRALSATEVNSLYKWTPGPVGYWKMDEGSWTNDCSTATVFDTSGNNNSLLACPASTGPVGASPGKFGNAGVFDGSDDYLKSSSTSLTDIANENVTVGAWLYKATSSSTDVVLAKKKTTSAADPGYYLYVSSAGKVTFLLSDGVDTFELQYQTAISYNTWVHVEAVIDKASASNSDIYINGVKTSSQQTGTLANVGTLTNTEVLAIGGQNAGNTLYEGKIDDAKVYNYVRTPSQIIEDMNGSHPAPGSPIGSAVARYKFDEGALNTCSGGTNDFCDSSLNGNDLPFSTTTGGYSNAGKFGKAWNGTGSVWIAAGADDNDFDFAAADDFSVSLWFKSDSASNPGAGAAQYLYTKGTITNTGTVGYAIYTDSTGKVSFGIRSTSGAWGASSPGTPSPEDVATSANDIYDANWHHIVAVKTGTTKIELFVDGVLSGSDTSLAATATLANSIALKIGDDDADATNSLAGDLDELQVFRSALTMDQVDGLYNQGASANLGSTSTNSSGVATFSDDNAFCPPGQGSACTAPVGYWKIDENTGTTAYDLSGNGNNGTLTGNGQWSNGKFGSGFQTKNNGIQDYITMGDPASGILDFTNIQDFTYQFWYKHGTTSDAYVVPLEKGGSSSTRAGYDFEVNASTLAASCNYSNGVADANAVDSVTWSSSTILDGNWHFIVCDRDHSGTGTGTAGFHLFVDGALKASLTSFTEADGSSSTRTFNVGEAISSYTNRESVVDEVRVYNYSRTRAQIAWDYNRGKPVGWWKLDESSWGTPNCSTTVAKDSSGNDYHMAACPNSTGPTGGATGKYNNGLTLDGSNDYLKVSSVPTTSPAVSISAWIKWNGTTGSRQAIFSEGVDSSCTGWILMLDSSLSNALSALDSCSTEVSSSFTPTAGVWTHVAAVRSGDSGTWTLYVNGKSVFSDAVFSQSAPSSQAMIGAYDSGSGPFKGDIDDVRLFNYPLTQQQINMIYNEGSAVRFSQ